MGAPAVVIRTVQSSELSRNPASVFEAADLGPVTITRRDGESLVLARSSDVARQREDSNWRPTWWSRRWRRGMSRSTSAFAGRFPGWSSSRRMTGSSSRGRSLTSPRLRCRLALRPATPHPEGMALNCRGHRRWLHPQRRVGVARRTCAGERPADRMSKKAPGVSRPRKRAEYEIRFATRQAVKARATRRGQNLVLHRWSGRAPRRGPHAPSQPDQERRVRFDPSDCWQRLVRSTDGCRRKLTHRCELRLRAGESVLAAAPQLSDDVARHVGRERQDAAA